VREKKRALFLKYSLYAKSIQEKYSKNYDFVPLPLPSRYRFWVILNTVTSPFPYHYLTVTDRYWSLLTVPDRYSPLPLLTVFLDKK
jgi:hypothetical protein